MVDGHEGERRIHGLVDDGDVEAVNAIDRLPVADAGAAERIDGEREAGGPNRLDVDDTRRDRVRTAARDRARASSARAARPRAGRGARSRPARRSALARSCIHVVTAVSAGPPFGGLYLKPPSSGGLCEGVTTMPSASPSARPRLWMRIAREIDRRRREAAVCLERRFPRRSRQALRAPRPAPAPRARACPCRDREVPSSPGFADSRRSPA